MMIRTLVLAICVLLASHAPAAAQAKPSAGPIKSVIQTMSSTISLNLVEAAEKMPEAEYAFKPTPDVRSFGELVGHVANASYFFCGQARGGDRPKTPNYEQVKAKADLVKGLKEAVAFCDSVISSATEAWLMEPSKWGSSNLQDGPRAGSLIFNVSHNNEHYGNMVTYLRLKGIVPPSTERAQQTQR